MFKKLVLFLVKIVAIYAFLLATLFLLLRVNITNPQIYKTFLDDSDVVGWAEDLLLSSPYFEDEASVILEQIAVTDILRQTLHQNIDNFVAWFNGQADDWLIYIPMTRLEETLTNLDLQQVLQDKPVCSDEELQMRINEPDLPDCIPNSVKQRLSAIDVSDMFNEFKKDFELMGINDENLAADLLRKANLSAAYSQILQAKNWFYYLSVVSLIMIVASILLFVLIFLWHNERLAGIKTVLNSFIYIGVCLIVVSSLGLVLANVMPSLINKIPHSGLVIMEYSVDTLSTVLVQNFGQATANILITLYIPILIAGLSITIPITILKLIMGFNSMHLTY